MAFCQRNWRWPTGRWSNTLAPQRGVGFGGLQGRVPGSGERLGELIRLLSGQHPGEALEGRVRCMLRRVACRGLPKAAAADLGPYLRDAEHITVDEAHAARRRAEAHLRALVRAGRRRCAARWRHWARRACRYEGAARLGQFVAEEVMTPLGLEGFSNFDIIFFDHFSCVSQRYH